MKRTKKRLKIKWNNIARLLTIVLILLVCAVIVIHDVYMMTIYSWITGRMASWTWYGFATFLLAFWIGGNIIEYIIEEFKK